MKDLMQYVNECKLELDSLGIKYGNVANWTVNTRAKKRLGSCKKVGLTSFEISISKSLLEDVANTQILKNTIIHELLHTVKGCFSHKGKWKLLAQTVNENLPDYCIKRTVDFNETEFEQSIKEPVFRYVLRCKKCGCEIKRQRLSKAVKNYEKYRCGKCGGKLEKLC